LFLSFESFADECLHLPFCVTRTRSMTLLGLRDSYNKCSCMSPRSV